MLRIVLTILITNAFLSTSLKCSAQIHTIKGRVTDAESGAPIPYANISLYTRSDSLINGSISDHLGYFKITDLPRNTYSIKISFVGYSVAEIKDIHNTQKSNLGDIRLKMLAQSLEEIVVSGKRPSIVYKVDRKVINADNNPGADVAMDLLENIPSVQLNFNGKLTYRGEGSFKVYINGNPVTNGEEKLKQIPISQIDRIEVITNPSAKFDSEGTAGIIQVILKKNRLEGYLISSSFKLDSRNEAIALFSIDKKAKEYGWYLQGQYCKYVWEKYSEAISQRIVDNGKTYETKSNTKNTNRENKSYIEMGFNYDFLGSNYINFSGYINPIINKKENQGEGNATETIINDRNETVNTPYDLIHRIYYNYQFMGASLTYEHRFNKERTHLLSFFADISNYIRETEDKTVDTKIYASSIERIGYIAGEKNEIVTTFTMGYKVPLSKEVKMEAGLNTNSDIIPKSFSVSGTYDDNLSLTKFEYEPLNQTVSFNQNIFSAYSSFEAEFGKFAALLGIRAENTYRQLVYKYDLPEAKKTIKTRHNFLDFFPTAHFTYSFTEDNQLYLSYSKRIGRPDYWSLIPLQQYQTPYSYYTGNGNLKPSGSNAFEMGYKRSWNKNFIASELFVRQTKNVIQNYSRVEAANMLSITPENVGSSTNIGIEVMAGLDLATWWNLNVSSSAYSSKLKVEFEGLSNTRKNFRIDGRINNTFKLPYSFIIKCDFNYKSPMYSAQQIREGYFFSNISLRKGFMDNRWAAIATCNNVFSTIKYYTTTEDQNLYLQRYYEEKPYVSLKFIYTFNNQK